jgi:cobalamin biosynthesis protein CobW
MNSHNPDAASPSPDTGALFGVPAVVVSGFLGAGKTTLVKHLIADAQRQGLRLAVVSNEFGELGIDKALLQEAGGSGYVELAGGCVCCQLSGELLSTLQSLWETIRPDRIVVETSGVALPFETLMTFWREPLTEWVGESLAVVVVNAEQVAEGRDIAGTFSQQVSSADLVVLNKLDLVSAESLSRVDAMLQELAPGAPVLHSIQGQIDSAIVFPPTITGLARSSRSRTPLVMPHRHEEFEAREISMSEGITPDQLIHQVRQLQALRVKGVVRTSEGLRVVQGVGSRVDLAQAPNHLPAELVGRLVVITRT